jgi:hypothetical protein
MMKRQSIEKRLEALEQIHQDQQPRPEILPASWRDMPKPPPYIKRSELENVPRNQWPPSWCIIEGE